MTSSHAFQILDALSAGVDPQTGEALPENSLLYRREVIRALQMAQDALWQLGNRFSDQASQATSQEVVLPEESSLPVPVSKDEAGEEESDGKKKEVVPAVIERGLMLRAIEEAAEQSDRRLSPAALARWLLGRGNLERAGRTFGALQSQYGYPQIKATTDAFFSNHPELVEPRLRPWDDEPVALDPLFNRLSERAVVQLRSLIAALPHSKARGGAGYIQAARERYPRAFQPWSAEEIRLLERAVSHTNDLQFLSHSFGRTQASLLEQIKRIRYRQRIGSATPVIPRDRHPAS